MKWHLIAILSLLFLLGYCAADGMPMPSVDYTQEVFLPEQKAVIFWDGLQEQLIIESKITVEDIANVAWLIPIESSSKPTVEAADEQIFFDLAELFAPKPTGKGLDNFGLSTSGLGGGVEVIDQLKVDIYDITVLRATSADALIEWLNSNGYSFPAAFPNLLQGYVQNGSIYFIANKINLQNKYPGMQPTQQDFECAQETEEIVADSWWQASSEEVEAEIKDIVEHRAWSTACPAGVNADAVAALVLLRLGIATPLKITFTPSKPFYPMLLSSLNVGQGSAKVYFVSSEPYKDDSGLFAAKSMLQAKDNSLSDYGINQGSFITMLSWENSYSTLGRDSFFSKTAFVPELDPTYVPPWEIFMALLPIILIFALFLSIITVLLIIAPFLIGIAVSWVLHQKKNKKSFFAESNGLIASIVAALLILAGPILLFLWLIISTAVLGDFEELFSMSFIIFTIYLSIFALPYFISMACGFLFRNSGYKKIWLFGPIIIFILIVAIILALGLVISSLPPSFF